MVAGSRLEAPRNLLGRGKARVEQDARPRVPSGDHIRSTIRCRPPVRFRHEGFIPRVRGTPSRRAAVSPPNTVHPRVCGELSSTRIIVTATAGSSPRVRGTRRRRHGVRQGLRFIPACAGNSRPTSRRAWPRTVHPRVCGELRSVDTRMSVVSGSSPRVRGTRARRSAASAPRPVHPRVCGELAAVSSSTCTATGSSPRVRGTHRRRLRAVQLRRFIPACAGNSAPTPTSLGRTPVHPRVCGELAPHGHRHAAAERFIPACAGNSRGGGRAALAWPVHPRVCGELFDRCFGRMEGVTVHPRVCGELGVTVTADEDAPGSSPRVRGTPVSRSPNPLRPRFIPACAGNSPTR